MLEKRGFTTGTCAQAAAKASAVMLMKRKIVKEIRVKLPCGENFKIKIVNQRIGKNFASCAVIKESPDKYDVTNGIKIYAQVKFSPERKITIKGAEGVGVVTKPGLAVPVGKPAINPTPCRMIIKELTPYLPQGKGLEVIIKVPEGKRIARNTFNPRLGIKGGISIIGTSGLVYPKSSSSFKRSISLQLEVLKASKIKKVFLVLGYIGERFCREKLKINNNYLVKIGDYVGFAFRECKKINLKNIVLIGHIGKLIKVAKGQLNTHYKFGNRRIEAIVNYLKDYEDKSIIEKLKAQTTAEGAATILQKRGLKVIFNRIAKDAVNILSKLLDDSFNIKCIILSLKGELLGEYPIGRQ